MIGDKNNPILINDWEGWRGACVVELQPNSQIYGTITEHHRPDLAEEIKDNDGELQIVTSMIEEIMDDGIIRTRNTYYRLGTPAE